MTKPFMFPVYLPLCARIASTAVLCLGLMTMAGWAFDIPMLRSGFTGLTSMNPGGTALSLIMASLSLWFMSTKGKDKRMVLAGQICAGAVLVIAASYFTCRFMHCDGPDAMLFRDKLDAEEALLGHTNRMAPNTAAAMAMAGMALMMLDWKMRGLWPSQLLALGGIIIGMSTIMGYAFNAMAMAGVKDYIPMALNTGSCLVLLNMAILCARPRQGLMSTICSPGTGGLIARCLLPVVIVVPTALGWAYHRAMVSGTLAEPIVMGLFSMTNVLLLAGLIWWIASWLESAERERAAAEKMLQASEERFQLAVRGSNDGLWDWDVPNNKLYWSERFKDMLGIYDRDFQPSYEQFKARLHPEERTEIIRQLEDHVKFKTPYDTEFRMRREDGEYIWVRARGSSVWDNEGRATRTSGSVTDITDRRLATAEMLRARHNAEAASSAKSEFLANMSHELRTPLNSIIGMTRMLYEDAALNDEQREMISITAHSADTLLDIVNDILDLSKVEAGKLELESVTFSLREVTDRIVESILPLSSQKAVEFFYKFGPKNLPYFTGDPLRLGRVIMNLLSNALKYTHEGSVTLDVECAALDDGHMILRVGVTDTGIGVPENMQARIFEKFIQADTSVTRRYGGTGLGLSISKQIVEMMNGRIGVQSTEGIGSHFWFEIPLTVAADQAVTEFREHKRRFIQRPPRPDRKPAAQTRILVAEDHMVNQSFMRKLLARAGLENYHIVENGQALLAAWRGGGYDIIILDCHMPVMSGYEATATIRHEEQNTGAHIPIIAMTADAMTGTRERCLQTGMDDYISKPINQDEFFEVLGQWIILPERKTETGGVPSRKNKDTAFDVEGLRVYTNSEEELRALIATFVQQSDGIIDSLRRHCIDGKSSPWVAAAHKLKGGAAAMGAEELRAACEEAQMQEFATAAQRQVVLDRLIAGYAATRAAIDRYMEE